MKKFLSMILAITFLFSVCTVASAETIDLTGETPTVTKVSFKKKQMTVELGSELELKAIVPPQPVYDTSDLKWSSSNPKVVKVKTDDFSSFVGILTAQRTGTAIITITATKSGATASCKVTVKKSKMTRKKPAKVQNVDLQVTKTKRLKVTWRRQAGITGYEIQVAQNSDFKKAKTYRVKANPTKTAQKTLSIKKKKQYFVRIRSYKKFGKKYIYGNYRWICSAVWEGESATFTKYPKGHEEQITFGFQFI